MSDPIPVLVFGRTPRPGAVKRRLIPALGTDGAARLYEDMLRATVRTAAGAGVGPVELWVTPTIEHPLLGALAAKWGVTLHSQRGADLGARMQGALERTLRSAPGAILVGSDCPSLAADDLREATRRLQAGDDVVLGPAVDGGYYLIGLARPVPELFRDVSWGSEEVLALTRQRLSVAGSRWSELTKRRDVDRPSDLHHLERPPGTGA
ncbi:MAG: glycosyltransferase [Gammaproteobacteria bacterium]|nr:glycosyltransferase [Gammaproteobacteria bacterium]NIR88511.1 glycosyltransferase [Gammaproteobacteria bacterium]NIU05175.1 glycosyltransferase [Gammaproteobacteria bacterium]NIV52018.1 DUF2064 domain-containing protein [Gammaproteobacteria bacterium]NIW86180.1 DUF2064 domain-containing protein [Gammaproteobacteria bacterium]